MKIVSSHEATVNDLFASGRSDFVTFFILPTFFFLSARVEIMMMNCGNVIIEQLWEIVVLLFSAVHSSNEKVRVRASLDDIVLFKFKLSDLCQYNSTEKCYTVCMLVIMVN